MTSTDNSGPGLILASGSTYRAQLLARLALPFEVVEAGIDEAANPGESASAVARRLARGKAEFVARRHDKAVIIGADQCACLGNDLLGKPGNHQRARAQLRAAAGNTVSFFTAVRVLVPGRSRALEHLDRTRVVFRELTDDEIERYLRHDRPYDCAGAFKVESLGIGLFSRIDSSDPTALIGLPLIALAELLRQAGLRVP